MGKTIGWVKGVDVDIADEGVWIDESKIVVWGFSWDDCEVFCKFWKIEVRFFLESSRLGIVDEIFKEEVVEREEEEVGNGAVQFVW